MNSNNDFREKVKNYLMFAGPTTIAFLLVIFIPFIYGVYLTFTDYTGFSANFNFVGLQNYLSILQDKRILTSFLLTFKYVFLTVILVNILAFFLGYLLTRGGKGENLLRVGFFTPNLIGGIVLGLIWKFIFSNVLVFIGKNLDIQVLSTSWLGNPDKAFWTLVIVSVWQYSGYMMLIYIAGFMAVPNELIEAAKIDGAGKIQQLKGIIVPLMIPSFIVSVFLTLRKAFLVYDINLALTDGGPFRSTELISMHVYKKAFLEQQYGVGQSEAFILFLIVATITFFQVYFSKKMEVEQ